MRTISEDRLRELTQGYETWSKTASSRPQIDIDTADALRELLSLRTPPSGEAGEVSRAYSELAVWANEVLAAYDETISPGGMPNAIKGLRAAYASVTALPTIKEPTDGK